MPISGSEEGSPAPRTEVSHRVFACERCSRRKQRAGCPCATSEREKGVVQVSKTEIARKGYVTTLLERIASLEQQLTAPDATICETSDNGRSGHRGTQSGWPLESADVNMESLSLSAMAEPIGRAGEFLKQLSIPRVITSVTETYGGNPEATSRVDSLWDGISKYIRHPSGQMHRLHVEPAEANKFLEHYLDIVDFRFPRLPLAKVKLGIDAITCEDESAYNNILQKDPALIFMAYMVMAIVPLVSDKYPISQGSFVSIQLLGKCLKVLDRVFRQEDGVDIIQCLHLLVIFSIHCSAAGSSWHLIGFAMNKCISLGYHTEISPSNSAISPEEREQRRWAFWSCFLLDRLICAALGRPFAIHNDYVTVSLPGEGSIDSSCPDPRELYYIHLFRYARLLSSIITSSSVEKFDSALSRILQWRMATPPNIGVLTREPYLHQTSLYHTLILRTGIHEILRGYKIYEAEDGMATVTHERELVKTTAAVNTTNDPEYQMMVDIKLFDICTAVACSLDRNRMTGRHYLSHLTGYSAFSMGLATVYHELVRRREALGPNSSQVIDNEAEVLNPLTGTPSGWSLVGENSTKRALKASEILNMASSKLEIVARQFPRMHEYKQTLETIRPIVFSGHSSMNGDVEHLKGAVMDINPTHLRHLGLVIWHCHVIGGQ
ncbi:unnamed protein product [Clonostachys rosea]|uniref:Xylanolytic transcriptional activator regulatory domain-containing protein n=1 Tax=Bionectria ochroleuca TaxID=29856 RepID=A0ABY6U9T1_BIOOC|nr:unnamed protein product [Clonostachys rosea]